jgi:argininosuccinate lyase
VGRAVRLAESRAIGLDKLTLAELRSFAPAVDEDVQAILTVDGSVAARDHLGGTAPRQVRLQTESWTKRLTSGAVP